MEQNNYSKFKLKLLTAVIQMIGAIGNLLKALKGKPRSFFDL